MHKHRSLHPVALSTERSLFSLVENRTAYSMKECELNIFETYSKADKVSLKFGDLVLTSMLRGKKVMHLFGEAGFDYLPGESVIVPANEKMKIDFPEASRENPTQCLALAISDEIIKNTIDLLNENYPKSEAGDSWQIDEQTFHLVNSFELSHVINNIIKVSLEEKAREKDILVSLSLKELLVRLMQTQARKFFEQNFMQLSTKHRFAEVIRFIKSNIKENLKMETLSEVACMSRTSFFRNFKRELGVTPLEYVQTEKVNLAKKFLKDTDCNITEACFKAGFNDLNSFIRTFKQVEGITPKNYKNMF